MEDVRNEIKVGDAMTVGIIGVGMDDTVQIIARVMKANNIDSVIVMEGGEGIGIITERDIIWKVIAESMNPEYVIAKDIMVSELITAHPDDTIEYAAQQMRNEGVRRLPVCGKDGKIMGMLTMEDIVRVEPALHRLIEEHSRWNISDLLPISEGTLSGVCERCGNYSDDLKPDEGRLLCGECILERE